MISIVKAMHSREEAEADCDNCWSRCKLLQCNIIDVNIVFFAVVKAGVRTYSLKIGGESL